MYVWRIAKKSHSAARRREKVQSYEYFQAHDSTVCATAFAPSFGAADSLKGCIIVTGSVNGELRLFENIY